MNQRKVHRFCMLLLAFAVCIRVLCAAGVEARAEQALRASGRTPLLLSWLLSRSVQDGEQTAAQKVWVVQLAGADAQQSTQPPPQPEMQPEIQPEPDKPALTFSDSEAAAITVAGACSYPVDR